MPLIAKRFLPAVLLLLVTLPALCRGAEEPSKFPVNIKSDIVFAEVDGVELLLDLHLPVGVENPPLVMFIHGGGWKNGDRKRCKLAWVAPRGYAVASVEYRLSHEALFPAQIHDCKGALRWLRAHQSDYGFDARRVVVAGTSAGGHLAALMGTSGGVSELEGTTAGHADQSSEVQGIIDYYGPTDFILRSRNQPAKTEVASGSVFQLLGGPVSQKQDLARLASPVSHVGPGDPPLLILHGEKDTTVYLPQSRRLLSLYQDQGLTARLCIEPGRKHGWNDPSAEEQEVVLEFLAKHLREN
jgi:acetyl esterase/lipase